jgi:rare lipoprotein A
MRYLFASLVLALLVCTGSSLPAAAEGGEFYRWSDRSPDVPRSYRGYRRDYGASRYVDDEDEARPRRRAVRHDGDRPRLAKRRHTHVAKNMRRHKRVARKPAISRSKTAHKRPADRTVTAPVPPQTSPKKGPTREVRKGGMHGVASYYWQPQALASGGRFNPNALTAAHKTLPFGTRVRVTHLGNGRSVEVKINDRGPYIAGRIIDLSRAAAGVIGMTAQGIARVAVEILGK